MDREKMKLIDEGIENNMLIQLSKESYITKEDLIKMLENLNFSHVKELTLEVITGFKIECDDDKKHVRTLGYRIDTQ